MTWYLEVVPVQEPFDLGLDEPSRLQYVFNVVATKRPSGTFLEELAQVLEDAGVGTRGTDIFLSSNATMPDENGPFITLTDTGGPGPLRTHNEAGPTAVAGSSAMAVSYQRPTAQVVTRARSASACRAKAYAAYSALSAVRNREVVP
jgi:hypothetical protein